MSEGVDTSAAHSAKPLRLERLRIALAEHNWLSVVIEVLVVMVGVLLAFEVEQWGERRERAAQERQFMNELYADTRAGVAELNGLLATHNKVLREVPLALQAKGDPAKLATLPRRRDFGCGLASPLLAPYNDTAYEELIQSGRLSLLSDPALRTAVRDLAASQHWGASQAAFTRELLTINLPPITPYYELTVDRNVQPICRIDWPKLLLDKLAVNATTRLIRRHRQTWEVRQKTLAQTLKVQRMLACKLDRPECQG